MYAFLDAFLILHRGNIPTSNAQEISIDISSDAKSLIQYRRNTAYLVS